MKKQQAKLAQKENPWQTYLHTAKTKEPERLEDAAKFLSGMISISLTIFLKVNDKGMEGLPQWVMIATVVLWLLALTGAFFVFFPFSYPVSAESPRSIEAFHTKMVQRKRRLLLGSTVCFFLALVILGVAYLSG